MAKAIRICGFCLALASVLAAGGHGFAQAVSNSAQPLPPADTMTLHVTVRELQVAALVLDGHRRPVSEVDPKRFRMQIERRPVFTPMRVHREGDDPFTLAVLIDASHENKHLDELPEALANLRQNALLPHDHLFVSAVDCKGVAYRAETNTPAEVRTAVQQLLVSPLLHDGTHKGKPILCSDRAHVWDEIAYSLRRVAAQPGRHVVLVVSNGFDGGSVSTIGSIVDYTTTIAATVFVLPFQDMSGPNVRRGPLDQVVQLSGGAVLETPGRDGIEPRIFDCVAMLRSRFILGFNQPSHLKPGHNELHVSIPHSSYDIRTSGVSTPNEVPVSDQPRPDANPPQASTAGPQPPASAPSATP